MDEPRNNQAQNRDIIVIGGSAGSIGALRQIIPALPSDIPAAVFIVVHIGERTSLLHEFLGRATNMPVERAINGAMFEHGRIYIARTDRHLLLHNDHMLLRRSAHENLARPAVDPLFRSAAASLGSRVIGIVLSGALDDGSAGLLAIERCGGITMVQDPSDAEYSDMPLGALRVVNADYCAPASDIAALVTRLVGEPAGPSPPAPMEIRVEAAISAQELTAMKELDKLGKPSRMTCPECSGDLWEIKEGALLRYRCHVGHAYTSEAMDVGQAQQMEHRLWQLLRLHQERSELMRTRAEHERDLQHGELARQFAERAQRYEQDADLIRELLRHGDGSADREHGTHNESDEAPREPQKRKASPKRG